MLHRKYVVGIFSFTLLLKILWAEREAFAKRVNSYFENQAQNSKLKTVNHFIQEGKRKALYTLNLVCI